MNAHALDTHDEDLRPDDFSALFDAHRGALRAHCYRMTGSFADSEELTQETFLRAWRDIDRFEGRSTPQTWLYRIATNACLDFLKRHERRAHPTDSIAETLEREAWIDPYPDQRNPADIVADDETTDLYLTAALLHLPPRQRAVVVARDLLDFNTAETAAILDCSATATNSLLQRAHARLRLLTPDVDELTQPADRDDGDLVRAYIDAHKRGDVDAIVELLSDDVRISMPPEAPCIGSHEARSFYTHLLGAESPGVWHLVPTRANGDPAIANYLRSPGDPTYRALSVDVLRIDDGRIAAIHCFLGGDIFPAFALGPACANPEGHPGLPLST